MNVLSLTLCLVGIFACIYLMRWRFHRSGHTAEGLTFVWRTVLFAGVVSLLFWGLTLLGVPL